MNNRGKGLEDNLEWSSKQRKQKVQRLQDKNVQGGVKEGPKNPSVTINISRSNNRGPDGIGHCGLL